VTLPRERHGTFLVRRGDEEFRVEVAPDGGVEVSPGVGRLDVTRVAGDTYRVRSEAGAWHVVVAASGDRRHVFVDGEVFEVEIGDTARPRRATHQPAGALVAPMPARVREVLVTPGQQVAAGDLLVTLEAMKMELAVRAPRDGRVVSVACRPGELVPQGLPLLELA
jgi:3-methylcrotonyl-CoA carboxylase alpha subunit